MFFSFTNSGFVYYMYILHTISFYLMHWKRGYCIYTHNAQHTYKHFSRTMDLKKPHWIPVFMNWKSMVLLNGIPINHTFFASSPHKTASFVRKFVQHFSWMLGLFVQFILCFARIDRKKRDCYLWLWFAVHTAHIHSVLSANYCKMKLNWYREKTIHEIDHYDHRISIIQ